MKPVTSAVSEYINGLGPTMAALVTNSDAATVNYQLNTRSIQRHRYNRRYTPTQILIMQMEYHQGTSAKELSKQYGLHISSIYRYLNMAV